MSDDSSSFFEPDTLLPSQYSAITARDDGIRPERRLMLAILADAVYCIQRYALTRSPASKVLFAEAAAWFTSTEREWLFSFESICDTLGLAPDQIRSELPTEQLQRVTQRRRVPRIVALTQPRLSTKEPGVEHHAATNTAAAVESGHSHRRGSARQAHQGPPTRSSSRQLLAQVGGRRPPLAEQERDRSQLHSP